MILKSIPKLIPAIFLDKDGTLIEDVPYNVDPQFVQFTEGAIAGLRLFQAAGYPLIIVSNQSGVARGYFPPTALAELEQHLRSRLASEGLYLQGFYSCPHHPEGVVQPYSVNCYCRKPQPGLLYQAADHHIEAGRAAGCRTILIDNGNETEASA
jgi:D-glycero-D-manno-heptose 1,7-bisphosphate phosphatase